MATGGGGRGWQFLRRNDGYAEARLSLAGGAPSFLDAPFPLRRQTGADLEAGLLRAGVDINTIRAWLGHVSLNTTNIHAEIDLEMKAQAVALCDAVEAKPSRPWKESKGLLSFLKSL